MLLPLLFVGATGVVWALNELAWGCAYYLGYAEFLFGVLEGVIRRGRHPQLILFCVDLPGFVLLSLTIFTIGIIPRRPAAVIALCLTLLQPFALTLWSGWELQFRFGYLSFVLFPLLLGVWLISQVVANRKRPAFEQTVSVWPSRFLASACVILAALSVYGYYCYFRQFGEPHS